MRHQQKGCLREPIPLLQRVAVPVNALAGGICVGGIFITLLPLLSPLWAPFLFQGMPAVGIIRPHCSFAPLNINTLS